MSTLELKFSIQHILDRIDDKKILEAVHTLLQTSLKNESVDFWDTLSDEEKKSIEKGLDDVKAGRVHTHEEVMKEVKEKYGIDKTDQNNWAAFGAQNLVKAYDNDEPDYDNMTVREPNFRQV